MNAGRTLGACIAWLAAAGCGQSTPVAPLDGGIADASSDAVGDAPDSGAEGGTEAAADGPSIQDANACTTDSSELACCCEGDIGGQVVCEADGSLGCDPGFGLYFGADCSRPCGPCAIACPDSGQSETGAD
jgi:hypothetical protein